MLNMYDTAKLVQITISIRLLLGLIITTIVFKLTIAIHQIYCQISESIKEMQEPM